MIQPTRPGDTDPKRYHRPEAIESVTHDLPISTRRKMRVFGKDKTKRPTSKFMSLS